MSGVGEGSYEEYVGTEGYDELERLVGEILDNKIGGEVYSPLWTKSTIIPSVWTKLIPRC